MKNIFALNQLLTKTVVAFGCAALLLACKPTLADDLTNTAASPTKNGVSIKITAGHDNSAKDNFYGLPKEAFERLSPEQIMALAQSQRESQLAPILVSLGMFTMIVSCVALGVIQRQKRNRMQHETVRMMIEKGLPLSPELLQPQEQPRRPRNDLRTGLVLIAVGIGIWLLPLGDVTTRSGLIPLLIGVAFLIVWAIEAKKNSRPK